MFDYVKGELYKTRKRSYTKKLFIYSGIISILLNIGLLVLNIVFKATTNSGKVFASYTELVIFSFFITLIVADNVFSKDYMNHTLKNPLAFGISRKTIYFGKFITSIIVGLVLQVFLVLGSLICTSLLFGINRDIFGEQLVIIFDTMINLFPLFIAGIAICHSLFFIFKHSVIVFILFIYGMIIPPAILNGTQFSFINEFADKVILKFQDWSILVDINSILAKAEVSQLSLVGETLQKSDFVNTSLSVITTSNCYIVGGSYSLVFLLIGWLVFSKSELR